MPAADAANPRANNSMGHIIKWKEQGDFDATRFRWSHFVMAGDPANTRAEARGNVKGDAYGSPDGLWFDDRGTLWIQTDAHATNMYKGDYATVGSNVMLAADVKTGETRRFLVGPVNCEITGVVCTPDMKTMFVNVQHPGESPSDRSDPANPTRFSTWPSGVQGARPRSATVVIHKRDGGVIGS
jgi:secreted PhoX family phosphatase